MRSEPDAADPAWRAALSTYEGRLEAQEVLRRTLDEDAGEGDRDPAELEARLARLWRHASDVERDLVLDARARGTVTPAAADEVLHDIEVRAARADP